MKITLNVIKGAVERVSKIEDISVKDRTRPLPDIRYTYMALCRLFAKDLGFPSQVKIGKKIKRNHSTVITGLRQFDILHNTKDFAGNEVYLECVDFLTEVKKKYNPISILHDKINNNLSEKIAPMNEKELIEFCTKMDLFFKFAK